MIRRLLAIITIAMMPFMTLSAQNSIDELVANYSSRGGSKFTSAVERDPKTRSVVKVVKVLTITGLFNVQPFVKAFKAEAHSGDFTENYDDLGMTLMLAVRSPRRNRVYMFKAESPYMRGGIRQYEIAKVTIIVKYK